MQTPYAFDGIADPPSFTCIVHTVFEEGIKYAIRDQNLIYISISMSTLFQNRDTNNFCKWPKITNWYPFYYEDANFKFIHYAG